VKTILLTLVVVAGVAVPVQVAANARMNDSFRSPALAALVAFAIGSIGLALLTVSGLLGRGEMPTLALPWWAWVGGLLSAFVAIITLAALKPLGAE
jgi:transporter family-2 protein